ncbi:11523_t:CDS:2 [Scutellospora calospora]|uniref:11523_t:CDS:1 n=1 Tax=Scutellospora calospora TaxID=85575 RepID=A0ACA9MWN0_9GLOM|nr:11523_t:CDS:2 [Scutellospora calospora]
MKDLIEKYTLCDLDVLSQVWLLRELFSEATIIDYDMKNYVYKFWCIYSIQSGDAAKLFEHFEKEYAKDPDWYVQPLIDMETNRLQAVTNAYNLPLSIFAVVDNNFKSRIVAQAILPDETSESYGWVLQQTIKATGVQPGAFIIDANSGLESVVLEIYPNNLPSSLYLAYQT